MQAGAGSIVVTAVKAELIRDVEVFGKMDPYVVFEHSGEKYKTKTHQDGGKTPLWD